MASRASESSLSSCAWSTSVWAPITTLWAPFFLVIAYSLVSCSDSFIGFKKVMIATLEASLSNPESDPTKQILAGDWSALQPVQVGSHVRRDSTHEDQVDKVHVEHGAFLKRSCQSSVDSTVPPDTCFKPLSASWTIGTVAWKRSVASYFAFTLTSRPGVESSAFLSLDARVSCGSVVPVVHCRIEGVDSSDVNLHALALLDMMLGGWCAICWP